METPGTYPLATRPPHGLDAGAQLGPPRAGNRGCSPSLSGSSDSLDGEVGADAKGSMKVVAGMPSEVWHTVCSVADQIGASG